MIIVYPVYGAYTAYGLEPARTVTPSDIFGQYRFLEDHWIGDQLLLAGTTAFADGSVVPINWIPSPNVEPLNAIGVAAFYKAGPTDLGLVRQQWTNVGFPPPTTYWKRVGPNLWQLTGLGASFPPLPAIIPHPVRGYPQ